MRRLVVPVFVAPVMLAALASAARADDDASRAHAAYERGTAAYKRGDFATAAREYALADATKPSAVALQAGLDAAIQADDPVIGTELLDRSARAPAAGELAELVKRARARFAGRTGRVRVTCASTPCLFAIDGVAMNTAMPVIVKVGPHTVTVQGEAQRFVEIHADEVIAIAPASAPAPAPAPAPATATAPATASASASALATESESEHAHAHAHADGVAPVWFYVGAGLTAIVGGSAIWSGLDATSKHSQFVDAGCPAGPHAGCTDLQSSGTSAQTRTNVLLGATAVLGVASAVLGIFVVRWRDDAPPSTWSVGLR